MDLTDLLIDIVGNLADMTSDSMAAYYDEEEEEEISQEELDRMVEARKMVPWRCQYCYKENPAEEEICLGCKKERNKKD